MKIRLPQRMVYQNARKKPAVITADRRILCYQKPVALFNWFLPRRCAQIENYTVRRIVATKICSYFCIGSS